MRKTKKGELNGKSGARRVGNTQNTKEKPWNWPTGSILHRSIMWAIAFHVVPRVLVASFLSLSHEWALSSRNKAKASRRKSPSPCLALSFLSSTPFYRRRAPPPLIPSKPLLTDALSAPASCDTLGDMGELQRICDAATVDAFCAAVSWGCVCLTRSPRSAAGISDAATSHGRSWNRPHRKLLYAVRHGWT